MARAGAVWLDVLPNMGTFNKAVAAGARGSLGAVGKQSGAEYSKALVTATRQGMGGFSEVVAAEAKVAAAEAEKAVTTATGKLVAARKRQADAAGQVRVAEARLVEVRSKGTASASQVAAAEERLARAQRTLETTSTQLAAREGELTVAQKAQGDAAALAGEKTAVAGVQAKEFGTLAQTGFGKAASAAKTASKVMVGFAAFGLADFGYHSLKAAGDFQASMNLLVTAGGESKQALSLVAAGVKSIAVQTGTSTADLAEGMYTLEKAGLRGASGLTVLRAAAQGARAENVDLGTMTNALTSIMRSYDLPASAAVSVTNQLVAASGAAKTTMQEFAGSLSTVLPVASAAGVSFAEVGGAIATLTSHGTSAQEATLELANTIRNLQAPNRVAINEMAQFGISSNDVAIQLGKRGLTGTIALLTQTILQRMGPSGTALLNTFNQSKVAAADAATMMSHLTGAAKTLATNFAAGKVSLGDYRQQMRALPADQAALVAEFVATQNKAKGFNAELRAGGQPAQTYTAALKQMLGGATGLNTALQLSGGSTATFSRNVDEVAGAAAKGGKNVSSWAITQQNFNVQMAQFKQVLNVLAIDIGSKLIPALSSTFGWVKNNASTVLTFAGAVAGLWAAFKGYQIISAVITMTREWAGVQALLDAEMAANPIGIIIVAIAALVAGIVYAYNHFTWFHNIVQAAWKGIQAAFSAAWAVISPIFHAISGFVTGTLGPSFVWLYRTIIKPYFDANVAVIRVAWQIIRSVLTTAVGFFRLVLAPVFGWLYRNIIAPNMAAIRIIIAAAWQFIRPIFAALGSFVRNNLVGSFNAAVQGIKLAWNQIKSIAAVPVRFVVNTVIGGLVQTWDKIAKAFGGSQVTVPHVNFATGGIAPGIDRGRDTVPAMLRPGEGVLVPELTAAIGPKNIIAANAAYSGGRPTSTGGHFAGGGIVHGLLNGVKDMAGIITDPTGVLKRLTGPIMKGLSRIDGTQFGKIVENVPKKVLASLTGKVTSLIGGLGGGPGGSSILGYARQFLGVPYLWGGTTPSGFDCSGFTGYVMKHFGIRPPRTAAQQQAWATPEGASVAVPGDLVFFGTPAHHVGFYEGAGRMIDAPHTGANVREESVWGELHTFGKIPGLVRGLVNTAKTAAGVGGIQGLGRRIATSMGVGSQFGAIDYIFSRESGWNPNAQNPTSTAYGIPQFLDSTWAHYGGKTSDPTRQIIDGIRYMNDRYGSPTGAEEWWRSHHWYDQGGFLPPGPSLVYNGTGSPEPVLTGQQWEVMRRASTEQQRPNRTLNVYPQQAVLRIADLRQLSYQMELEDRLNRSL